jgi:ketosteroid isomerase-like protein
MSQRAPAITAAQNSWRCVQERLRDEWLGLIADDITIEDPIGGGPSNPTGKGFRGRAEAEQFWDRQIAPTESITITVHESFVAGDESAHRMTLVTRFPNGVKMTVNGIFTYTVDDAGKLRALRGYWSMDEAVIEKSA